MSYLPRQLYTSRRFRKIILLLALVVTGATLAIVPLESASPTARIKNYFDALYWALTTVTTVGYGDMIATTVLGRIVSLILEVAGASLFLTIFVFVGTTAARSAEHFHARRTQEKLDNLEKQLETIHKHLAHLSRQDHPEAS